MYYRVQNLETGAFLTSPQREAQGLKQAELFIKMMSLNIDLSEENKPHYIVVCSKNYSGKYKPLELHQD